MSAADCIKNAGFLIVSCHCTNNKFIRYQNERLNHDCLQYCGRHSSHSAMANEICFVMEFWSTEFAPLKILDLVIAYCIDVRSCI